MAVDAADHGATAMTSRASVDSSILSVPFGLAVALPRAASVRLTTPRPSTVSRSFAVTSQAAASSPRFSENPRPPLLAFPARS